MNADPLILLAGVLLLGGVLLSKTSSRFGVPSLLLFLLLGMLAGSEGLLRVEFDDFDLARSGGVVALAFILFSGGLSTRWTEIRPVLAPGVALASAGVLLSAAVLGSLAALVFDLDPLEGMLLGAIIASTDAAAVFSILRSRGVQLGSRLRALLELESGSNDPAAVFLTVGLISLIQADGTSPADLVVSFLVQMGVGVVAGVLLAKLAVIGINGLRLEFDGLYSVFTFGFVLAVFEGVNWMGGSGFLAAYVAGLTMANSDFLHKRSLVRFHDAIAWMMQIGMFVVLGLLVFPSELMPVIWRSLAIAGLLMFVARPIAAVLTLLPFRMPLREVTFVSWVGLRGAAPIILATFPVAAGVPNAETIFNVVFFVVLTSVLVQGTTIPMVARRLRVTEAGSTAQQVSFDAVISGDTGHCLHELRISPDAPAVGRRIMELGLPPQVLLVLLRRGSSTVMPQGGTRLEADDELLLFAETEAFVQVGHLFDADVSDGPTGFDPHPTRLNDE